MGAIWPKAEWRLPGVGAKAEIRRAESIERFDLVQIIRLLEAVSLAKRKAALFPIGRGVFRLGGYQRP